MAATQHLAPAVVKINILKGETLFLRTFPIFALLFVPSAALP